MVLKVALLCFLSIALRCTATEPSHLTRDSHDLEQRLAEDRLRLEQRVAQKLSRSLTATVGTEVTATILPSPGLTLTPRDAPLIQWGEAELAPTEVWEEGAEQDAERAHLWLLNGVLKLSGDYVEPPSTSEQDEDTLQASTTLIDHMADYKAKQRTAIAAQAAAEHMPIAAPITLHSILATSTHHRNQLPAKDPNPYLSATSQVFSRTNARADAPRTTFVIDAVNTTTAMTSMAKTIASPSQTMNSLTLTHQQSVPQVGSAAPFVAVPGPRAKIQTLPMLLSPVPEKISSRGPNQTAQINDKLTQPVHHKHQPLGSRVYFRRLQRF